MKLIFKLSIGAALFVAFACAPRAASPSATASSNAAATPTATTTPTTTSVPSTETAQPATPGTITGRTGYPAEGHPAMTVYAISTTDSRVWFSVDIPRGTDSFTPYTISGVRPGTYNLFAAADGNERAGGAYSEFVKCGNRVGCSDHTPIVVTVRAGETVRDIEVSDWYAPPGTFPLRPR